MRAPGVGERFGVSCDRNLPAAAGFGAGTNARRARSGSGEALRLEHRRAAAGSDLLRVGAGVTHAFGPADAPVRPARLTASAPAVGRTLTSGSTRRACPSPRFAPHRARPHDRHVRPSTTDER